MEKREISKRTWTKVADVEDVEYNVEDLIEGTTYQFRVAAENDVGISEFVELPKPVTPKSQKGIFHSIVIQFALRLFLILTY